MLRKIIKIDINRSHILKLWCTEFNFGPSWGAHSSLSKKERKRKEKRKRKGERDASPPPIHITPLTI